MMNSRPVAAWPLMTWLLAAALPATAGAGVPACSAASPAQAAPLVVELYTSEGCNSCPPADHWLSSIANRPDVVALAFHVDYWDRLGWKDRFADARYTERQSQLKRYGGASVIYTPQVVVNGHDHRGWPRLPMPAGMPPVNLQLSRDGTAYVASLTRLPAAKGLALSGYWAITEDGHASDVKAGENAGVTLRHDAVVREYRPQLLPAGDDAVSMRFEPHTMADGVHARHVVFVVIDSRSGRVLQAARLDC